MPRTTGDKAPARSAAHTSWGFSNGGIPGSSESLLVVAGVPAGVAVGVAAGAEVDGGCVEPVGLAVARGGAPDPPEQAVAVVTVRSTAAATSRRLTRRAPRPLSA